VVIRCFGAFGMEVRGEPVDLHSVRPRARSLLRLLAIDPGRLVHWEALVEALWPEASPAAGKRSLQVAVSAVRHLLDPGMPQDSSLLTRVGDAYCLTLPDDAYVDVVEFAALARQARVAEAMGDSAAAVAAAEAALGVYGGDLLGEEGPAEWVLKARDGHRSTAADLAEMVASIHQVAGSFAAAAHACHRGLEIDRYRDGLWRTLVAAYRRSGDQAAAGRAGRDYAAVLADLGLGGDASG
jgi:DNA-binding SARP family transcriptional activator